MSGASFKPRNEPLQLLARPTSTHPPVLSSLPPTKPAQAPDQTRSIAADYNATTIDARETPSCPAQPRGPCPWWSGQLPRTRKSTSPPVQSKVAVGLGKWSVLCFGGSVKCAQVRSCAKALQPHERTAAAAAAAAAASAPEVVTTWSAAQAATQTTDHSSKMALRCRMARFASASCPCSGSTAGPTGAENSCCTMSLLCDPVAAAAAAPVCCDPLQVAACAAPRPKPSV